MFDFRPYIPRNTTIKSPSPCLFGHRIRDRRRGRELLLLLSLVIRQSPGMTPFCPSSVSRLALLGRVLGQLTQHRSLAPVDCGMTLKAFRTNTTPSNHPAVLSVCPFRVWAILQFRVFSGGLLAFLVKGIVFYSGHISAPSVNNCFFNLYRFGPCTPPRPQLQLKSPQSSVHRRRTWRWDSW